MKSSEEEQIKPNSKRSTKSSEEEQIKPNSKRSTKSSEEEQIKPNSKRSTKSSEEEQIKPNSKRSTKSSEEEQIKPSSKRSTKSSEEEQIKSNSKRSTKSSEEEQTKSKSRNQSKSSEEELIKLKSKKSAKSSELKTKRTTKKSLVSEKNSSFSDELDGQDNIYEIGYSQLNEFQKEIVEDSSNEAKTIQSLGLALPIGSGKTIISIVLSLRMIDKMSDVRPILVVCSKTLIESWKIEINKFFDNKLKYEIVQPNTDLSKFAVKKNTRLILTSVDTIAKCYKENLIDKEFTEQRFVLHHGHLGAYITYYNIPSDPYLCHPHGSGVFYSIKWGCLIIDEAQTYTNIGTLRCQSLGALSATYRWLLSGTLFDEPKAERILGYHILLNAQNKPRNLPDTKILIKSNQFKGLNEMVVSRATNLAFIAPKINDKIISHRLSLEEEKIYCMMRQILIKVKDKALQAKLLGNESDLRLFSSYKLVMVLYLRQALICPLLPVTSVIIDASDAEKRSTLSKIILDELKTLNLDNYLNNKNSVKSTRFSAVLSTLSDFKNRVIIFSCFASCLDLLAFLLRSQNRTVFRMTASMTSTQRGALIEKFRIEKNGILLMTYEIGSTGLNLQFADTVMFMDYWWNAARTQQGIGRVLRIGQTAEQVNIIFFNANTAIEKIIYEKQNAKIQILEELKTGNQKTKIPLIKMNEVIKMIEIENNRDLLQKIKYF